jgi:hypothetical protein
MKEKKKNSDYESSKIGKKNYNKLNINVQLNRELIEELKKNIISSGGSLLNGGVKYYIEDLIKEILKKA